MLRWPLASPTFLSARTVADRQRLLDVADVDPPGLLLSGIGILLNDSRRFGRARVVLAYDLKLNLRDHLLADLDRILMRPFVEGLQNALDVNHREVAEAGVL